MGPGQRPPSFEEWGLQGHDNRWLCTKTDGFVGVRWATKRGIDLQHLKLEYETGGQRHEKLVDGWNKDMATFL